MSSLDTNFVKLEMTVRPSMQVWVHCSVQHMRLYNKLSAIPYMACVGWCLDGIPM